MESLASSSFGELLKALRRRQRLTQSQLATELGVHRNTIGIWERGEFLPETKGIVLELARHLQLSDSETHQLLEASLTGLSPSWNVPYVRNPFFTGREEILEALHEHLTGDQGVTLTQSYALSGLGGIGKTQLAVEYTYRYSLSYSAVFWIEAESAETILSSFVAIAEHLQLPERQETDQQKIVAAVQRWLSTHNQWLLVWDNVEDLTLLQHFLPATKTGAILLTTRRRALATLAQSMEVPTMMPEEGLLLLLRRAGLLDTQATPKEMMHLAQYKPHEYRAAAQLVSTMDGLPLALDQAGAYIQETQCSLVAYLHHFETKRANLLSRRGERASEYPASVSTTWSLSFARVEQQNPVAAEFLHCCAFLHPDAIPEELFTRGAGQLSPQLRLLECDPLALNEIVSVLLSYSLIRRDRSTATLSMHRLVQAVLLDTLPETLRKQWQGQVIQALAGLFPERVLEDWATTARLVPHALICISWIEHEVQFSLSAAFLLTQTGAYLRERGQYTEAEPLLLRSLAIRKQQLGETHPDTATSLNDLANLYRQQGKYEQAEPLYQRALAIREQQLGETHPDTAKSLSNLAILYAEQGKYKQAEPLLQQALTLQEQHLGLQHPAIATSLHNLAELYRLQGKYEQAELLYQRSLTIFQQQLEPDHPNIASGLANLATLYRLQGKYEQAEPLFRQALTIREHTLVPTHPHLAEVVHEFAILRQEQGHYDEALSLYRCALAARTHALGAAHPDTINTWERLGALLCDRGRTEEVLELG